MLELILDIERSHKDDLGHGPVQGLDVPVHGLGRL
jgi:hypothetical protein